MRRIIIATTPEQIEKLRPDWEDLYIRCTGATMFQSYEWNHLAAEIFRERERPFVVYAEDSSGRGLVPACITTDGSAKFLGEELFDYPDVLSEGDPAALMAAWNEVERLRLPLKAHGLRSGSALDKLLAGATQSFGAAPLVSAALSAEEFGRRHTRSARLMRRLLRLGMKVRRSVGDPFLMRKIYELKAAQNAGVENLFRDRLRIDFMTAAAQLAAPRCEIFLLEEEDTVVAALVTFLDRKVRRFYATYYDSNWARWSPGAALLFEATRLSLEEGLSCDYMTGEQDYKLRLATDRMPLLKIAMKAAAGSEAAELSLAS